MGSRSVRTFCFIAVMALLLAGCREKLTVDPELDMSLDREREQWEQVREILLAEAEKTGSETLPVELAAPFIPEGARCLECGILGEAAYLDYQWEDARYIVSYFPDGVIEKTAVRGDGGAIHSVRTDQEGVQLYKPKKIRIK